MDDAHHARPAVRRYPRLASPTPELPAGFVPLRLVLQPGALCLELARPDLLLGRHSTADIRLTVPDLSRRHCRFLFTDGHWEVVDLDSLNGVFVNGEKVRESSLCHGDRLRVACLHFLVELPLALGAVTRRDPEDAAAVLRRIVDVLPGPGADGTQEYRKAS